MIVGLVSFLSPSSRFSGSRRAGNANFGSIDGERVTQDDFSDAQREVYLRYFLSYGTWPDRDAKRTEFDQQRETYQWLFLIRKLKEYNIQIDPVSAARAGDEILRNFGRGNPVPLEAFVQQVLGGRVGAEDFERYLHHYLGIQQLVSVVALGGQLVTPQEAQFLYVRDHQELSVQPVYFSASNYLAGVPLPSPDAVAQFYTNEMSAYHVPERVQVRYVAFEMSNSMAHAEGQLTNLSELVEAKFQELGTNYVRFAKTPAEVKARIRQEFLRERALADEQKKADEFANTLFAMEPVQAGNLAALAETNGWKTQVTLPFDEENGPAEFDGGPNFAKEAFKLTPDRPLPEQPFVGEHAVYLIALEKRIPDEILPLDQIRDRVAADYRYRQAVLIARRSGQDFVHAATNGLAHGRTFGEICAEAKVKPVVLPPFSLSTRDLPDVEDPALLNQLKQMSFGTPVGHVSDFSATRDGGIALYVQQRLPLDAAKIQAGMPAFLNLFRRSREQEAFDLWFSKESTASLRTTPLAYRKQSEIPAGQAQP